MAYPNPDAVTDMIDMRSAGPACAADVTAIGAAGSMAQRALEIGRG